ncbi:GspH/FimT family pseudopilin [Halomonas halocynthiae]|uniref:GspH/FimT family pseudopilin n=1 Tax=Halomonas halocynthiae TaxID=176290 RepID=UPI00040EBC31|nr:GspH/FimT family pseudopilin [Halomonas halocynthiae]
MHPSVYPAPHVVSGFTLVELLVTLSVLAMLAVVGVPAWQGLVETHRISADVRSVQQALLYARNQAVTRGQEVSVCAAGGGAHVCGEKHDWKQGWVVFSGDDESVGTVLRVGERLGAHSVTAGRAKAVFNARGEARGSNGSWHFCAGGAGRSLILSSSGRLRQTTADCS